MTEKKEKSRAAGVNRREFLAGTGVGAAGLALAAPATALIGEALTAPIASAASVAKPRKGGHLIYGQADVTGFNPLITHDTTSESFARLLFDPLVQITNVNDSPTPILAQAAPTISSDGLTYTFKLRSGVKWSDGQPLTSDDVLWTWQLLFQPQYAKIAYEYRGQAEATIDSVSAPDPLTFVVKTKQVYAPFLITFGTTPILPKHVLASVPVEQFNTMPFNSAPTVTSGQFKFVNWTQGTSLTLARNESYYRGAPYLAGVVNKVITGDPTQALKTGEVDISGNASPADIAALKGTGVKVHIVASDEMLYMRPNLDPSKHGYKLFGDVKVRQALYHAINRPGIVKAIFLDGTAVAADSIWSGSWAYDPKVKPKYNYSPKKAKAMLDAAGWKMGSGGVREKDGVQLKFSTVVNSGQASWVQMVEAIQQMWGAVGVKMTVQSVEDTTWITDLEDTRDWDMIVDEKAFGLYDPDPSVLLSSEAAAVGGENSGDWRNAKTDALLNEGLETVNHSKRKVVYSKLQNLIMEQLPFLPIVSTNGIWTINERVHGFTLGPKTQYQNWYWMKDVWVSSGD